MWAAPTLNQIPKEIALYITFLAKFLKADDVYI